MYNILIAEDSSDITSLLKLYFTDDTFKTFFATNGIDALSIVEQNEIHIALIDIMMPKMDGYELLAEIRKTSNMPILIMSAKSEDNDRILGLNIGADDYIAKPFNPMEVVARVNAALRRHYKFGSAENSVTKILSVGSLKLDTMNCVLTKDEEEIPLTATEYKILAYLMSSPNRIFSKLQISTHVNGEYYETDDNSVTVHISHIREKIGTNENGNNFIVTVKGLGYKIENK